MPLSDLIAGLPGEALVRQGLVDCQAGHRSEAACLVSMARARLTRAGLLPDPLPGFVGDPETQLYQLLRQQGGDAYSRYNALLRELVSFESALDFRRRKIPG